MNKVVIRSPLHVGVEYKYLMSDAHYELFISLTDNGKNMNLKIFSQLSQAGALNKRWIPDVSKIKI